MAPAKAGNKRKRENKRGKAPPRGKGAQKKASQVVQRASQVVQRLKAALNAAEDKLTTRTNKFVRGITCSSRSHRPTLARRRPTLPQNNYLTNALKETKKRTNAATVTASETIGACKRTLQDKDLLTLCANSEDALSKMTVEESEQGRDGAKCTKHAYVGPLIKPRDLPTLNEKRTRLEAALR